jgi:hypothetical protein
MTPQHTKYYNSCFYLRHLHRYHISVTDEGIKNHEEESQSHQVSIESMSRFISS